MKRTLELKYLIQKFTLRTSLLVVLCISYTKELLVLKMAKDNLVKKKLVFPTSSATDLRMRCKQTPTQRQLHNKAKRLSSMGGGVPCKTAPGGKTFRAPIPTKTPRKGGGGVPVPMTGGIKKPKRRKLGIVDLREIQRFQKSVDLLIPLLCFSRVV